MTTYVLVHGAWHDGSSWSQVVKRLESLGHTAFAPTVAGHGKGVDKQVGYAEATRSVVDFIIDNDLTNIVLVGHSSAVLSSVKPQRLSRIVLGVSCISVPLC